MEYRIDVANDNYGYYIKLNSIASDNRIINILGLEKEFYYEKGIEYNGKLIDDSLYFTQCTDCLEFKKWLEQNIDSFLITKKLMGE